jgi:hypothetical protein
MGSIQELFEHNLYINTTDICSIPRTNFLEIGEQIRSEEASRSILNIFQTVTNSHNCELLMMNASKDLKWTEIFFLEIQNPQLPNNHFISIRHTHTRVVY